MQKMTQSEYSSDDTTRTMLRLHQPEVAAIYDQEVAELRSHEWQMGRVEEIRDALQEVLPADVFAEFDDAFQEFTHALDGAAEALERPDLEAFVRKGIEQLRELVLDALQRTASQHLTNGELYTFAEGLNRELAADRRHPGIDRASITPAEQLHQVGYAVLSGMESAMVHQALYRKGFEADATEESRSLALSLHHMRHRVMGLLNWHTYRPRDERQGWDLGQD